MGLNFSRKRFLQIAAMSATAALLPEGSVAEGKKDKGIMTSMNPNP